MILAIAAAVAAAAPAPAKCPDVVTPDALICRALIAQEDGRSDEAAQNFEEAAKASPDKDPQTARMYAAAGNMWIAAGQAGKAALDLDKALAMTGLEGEQRGEALLDRDIAIDCPVRLIHGELDTEVPLDIAFRTMRALRSADVQLNVIKGGGHRLSEPHEIDAILRTVAALLEPAT